VKRFLCAAVACLLLVGISQAAEVPFVELKGNTDAVRLVSFSPDGKQVSTCSNDEISQIWDAETGEALFTLKGCYGHFLPDGKKIVTSSKTEDAKIQFWDAESGKELFALPGQFWDWQFTPDGKKIVTRTEWITEKDGITIQIWDTESGVELLTWTGKFDMCRLLPNGKRIMIQERGRLPQVIDVESGRELYAVGGLISPGNFFSPDGTKFISVDTKFSTRRNADTGGEALYRVNTVRILNAETGEELYSLPEKFGRATFTPDGKIAAADGHTVRILDAESKKELHMLPVVLDDNFLPGGKKFAVHKNYDLGTPVQIWDVESGKQLYTLPGNLRGVAPYGAFAPDGKSIVTETDDKILRIWNAETGEELFALTEEFRYYMCVPFSPNGKKIVTIMADNTVRIWDLSAMMEEEKQ